MGIQVDSLPAGTTQDDQTTPENTIRRQHQGVEALASQFAKGVPLSGLNALVKTAKFTHNVATILSVPFNAKGAWVIACDSNQSAKVKGRPQQTSSGQVKLTLVFDDTTATNVWCAVILVPDGGW